MGSSAVSGATTPAPFRFPTRRGRSLEDGVRHQARQALESRAVAQSRVLADWRDLIRRRPFDIPLYSALRQRATIIIYFSAGTLRDAETIESVLSGPVPMRLQMEAFLKASYPVVRCNFVFPDDVSAPCTLESGLDVADGDVQDFIEAACRDAHIDVIIAHENQIDEGIHAVCCSADHLARMIRREVDRALRTLRTDASESDFARSYAAMERAFPAATAGVSPAKSVPLVVVGEARNRFIRN